MFPLILGALGGLTSLIGGGISAARARNMKERKRAPLPKIDRMAMPETARLDQYDENRDLNSQIKAGELSQYSMNGPSGSVNWSGTGPNRTLNVSLNPLDQAKMARANDMLGSLSEKYGEGAGEKASNAYYNKFLRTMQPQMADEEANLKEDLVNRGIPVGSDAYNKAFSNLKDTQNRSLENARDQSILSSQNVKNQELQNALSLFGAFQDVRDPMANYNPNLMPKYESTYDKGMQHNARDVANQMQTAQMNMDVQRSNMDLARDELDYLKEGEADKAAWDRQNRSMEHGLGAQMLGSGFGALGGIGRSAYNYADSRRRGRNPNYGGGGYGGY